MAFLSRPVGLGFPKAIATALSDSRKGAQFAIATVFGSTTLIAGTKTVAVAGMNALSSVALTLTAPGGATQGVKYKVVPSAGQFIVTGVDNTGATVATDTSAFNYKVETPLFHADQTASSNSGDPVNPAQVLLSVTPATPVDLPTVLVSANYMRQVMNLMLADSTAHLIADAVNPVVAALAVDLPSVITLLNAVKAAFNAHLIQAGVHINADTVNTVATANATILADSLTLAIAMKTAINAHLASAPTGESVLTLNT